MSRMIRFALALIVLAGCFRASNKPHDGTDAARTTEPEAGMTCKDETPTGSMLTRRKCRSDNERTQDRNAAEQQILNPSSRPTGGPQ